MVKRRKEWRVGNQVRAARKMADLTLEELAWRAGTSQPNLWAIEMGHHAPGIELASALADALSIPIDTLFPLKKRI